MRRWISIIVLVPFALAGAPVAAQTPNPRAEILVTLRQVQDLQEFSRQRGWFEIAALATGSSFLVHWLGKTAAVDLDKALIAILQEEIAALRSTHPESILIRSWKPVSAKEVADVYATALWQKLNGSASVDDPVYFLTEYSRGPAVREVTVVSPAASRLYNSIVNWNRLAKVGLWAGVGLGVATIGLTILTILDGEDPDVTPKDVAFRRLEMIFTGDPEEVVPLYSDPEVREAVAVAHALMVAGKEACGSSSPQL